MSKLKSLDYPVRYLGHSVDFNLQFKNNNDKNSGEIFTQGISFDMCSKEYRAGDPESDTLTLPRI